LLVNNTVDTSDDITVLSPAQTIPIQVTLTGLSGTVNLSVSPAGRASLSQMTLNLTSDQPVTVTLTPLAVSQAANDVQITATGPDGLTGQGKLTIVNVSIPDIINEDTPTGMPDRIPRNINTLIPVTVQPNLTGSGQSVTLAKLGSSSKNGDFTINGGPTLSITSTTTVYFSGTMQTAATGGNGGGNAGKLKVVAQVRGQNTATSPGFSIAAIPMLWIDTFDAVINGPLEGECTSCYGMSVYTFVSSDSADQNDLGAVQVSEALTQISSSGSLENLGTGSNSGYQPATDTIDDLYTPQSFVTAPGTLVLGQLTMFEDQITGVQGVPVAGSGYTISRSIAADASGVFHLTTCLASATVTATPNGTSITSSPGTVVPDDPYCVKQP
jgi:hypothetical protein